MQRKEGANNKFVYGFRIPQDLRAEVSNIEPKHEKEIASLINSYKSLYNEWVFELRYVLCT